MEEIVSIGSLTYAQKAKRALAAKGIRTRLIKSDAGTTGCTYSLSVPEKNYLEAIAILRASNIPYRGTL